MVMFFVWLQEGRLTQEEFLIWSFQSKVPQGFAELLFEVSINNQSYVQNYFQPSLLKEFQAQTAFICSSKIS